jgi:exonuclease V gamma subunit
MVIPLDEPDSPGNAQIFAGTLREGWYQPGDSSTAFWYTASKKGAKELFQFQLESLLLRCASGEASVPVVQTTALFRDGEKCVLPLPSPTEAARLLGSLLPLFRLGRILPLPFWPEIFEALQKAKVSPSASDEPTRCAALRLALERWLEADFSGAPPPSEQSATQFAFRGCENPFEWSPDTPESAFLPEPSAPLAWRLFVRMSAWREALPSA